MFKRLKLLSFNSPYLLLTPFNSFCYFTVLPN